MNNLESARIKSEYLHRQSELARLQELFELRRFFHSEVIDIFNDHHSCLEKFEWEQFTRDLEGYFDRSTFKINGYWTILDVEENHLMANVYAAAKDIEEFLGEFDTDDLRALFGDFVKVTVYKDHVNIDPIDSEDDVVKMLTS